MSVKFFLNAVRSSVSDVYTSFAESRVGSDGYGGKSIPEVSICKCVDVILVRLILNILRQEGHCNFDFVSVRNSTFLRARIGGYLYFFLVSCSL